MSLPKDMQMWGEQNCLSFEIALAGFEPPIDSPVLYCATNAPHYIFVLKTCDCDKYFNVRFGGYEAQDCVTSYGNEEIVMENEENKSRPTSP